MADSLQIYVTDTNIWIDLYAGGIIDYRSRIDFTRFNEEKEPPVKTASRFFPGKSFCVISRGVTPFS